ncbi:MAG TPA: gamma-glutamylcyclotransferase family protein [Candidatus Binatia bacterium]|jgi:gamma-glutamylcyclotransferase (GGCT)/AIG2-like uncharacterized protein YtfP|nr:gamma-glutamylcyclotransferase family protein [Candidatus Binatia bacterium]
MHKEMLFAYGTLRDGDIRKALFGGLPAGEPDMLHGFLKTTTSISGVHYPNIVPAEDVVVHGEVLEVDEDTLRRVDAYESEAYQRRRMRLASGKQAWVYIRD